MFPISLLSDAEGVTNDAFGNSRLDSVVSTTIFKMSMQEGFMMGSGYSHEGNPSSPTVYNITVDAPVEVLKGFCD